MELINSYLFDLEPRIQPAQYSKLDEPPSRDM